MEKKIAERPPSRMRGTSILPSEWRAVMSKLGSRRRWVVSSWVSMTMEENWSFLACGETDGACARDLAVIRTPRRHTDKMAEMRMISFPPLERREREKEN